MKKELLSLNLMKLYTDKINWIYLSSNPNALHLLEQVVIQDLLEQLVIHTLKRIRRTLKTIMAVTISGELFFVTYNMNIVIKLIEKSFQFQFHKDNTFCISLLSHIDRWQKMMKRFTILNMNVTRFNASIEKDLSIDPLPFSNSLNTLQKCCAHSHIQLWKLLLSSKEDYFLILEDDACFDKDWLKK